MTGCLRFGTNHHRLQIFVCRVILIGGKKVDYFTWFVYLMYCDCNCSVDLPHGAMGWTAVCYCGIFQSFSLTLLKVKT